ncbi:MAG: A24 family peptidase [Alphaproteobacteria bacterium]|nr:A24 family peptidase [Alphaproteobacteria bacterium]
MTPIGAAFVLCYAAVWCGLWAATRADGLALALAAVLAVPCIWLSLQDLADFTIPDAATLVVAATGLTGQWLFNPATLGATMVIAALVTAVFWGAGALHYRMRGQEGFGIGDAKLLGAGVLCVGAFAIWWVVLIAALGGIVLAVIDRIRRPGAQGGIPFGPFLAFAIYVVFVFQMATA